jgi:hypothetical protein
MKVQQISVNVRYSKALAQGEYKTVELGLEAALDEEEDWGLAQQGLYAALTTQLRMLWSKNGHNSEHAQNGSEAAIEGSWEEIKASPSPAKAHWCSVHNVEFRRFEKDGRWWYSHRDGDSWCKEQPPLTGKGR